MEPEDSSPQSQVPATCPYPEPDQSSPFPPTHILKIHLNIIHPSTSGSSSWSLSLGFPTKSLYALRLSPIRATCPVHLMLLDFITPRTFCKQYRPHSSSLCSLPHSPVTSSLLGPNIFLSTLFLVNLSLCERPSFAPTQNNRQSYSSVYVDFYVSG